MTKRNAKKAVAAIPSLPTIIANAEIELFDANVLDLIPDADPLDETSELETIVAQAEAHEEQGALETLQVQSIEASAEAEEPEMPALADVLNDITREDAEVMQRAVIGSLDEREAFEKSKKGDGHNILKTIAKARGKLAVSMEPSRVLIAACVDPLFMNRELSDGNRYNVYAIDKVQDFLNFLAGNKTGLTNAINVACMKSLFAFKRAGVAFTLDTAKGAASIDYARSLDKAVRRLLISHTVSRSTAPTQSSSTMQALVTLGVVNAVGSRKNPTYELSDSPLTKALEERYAA